MVVFAGVMWALHAEEPVPTLQRTIPIAAGAGLPVPVARPVYLVCVRLRQPLFARKDRPSAAAGRADPFALTWTPMIITAGRAGMSVLPGAVPAVPVDMCCNKQLPVYRFFPRKK